MMIGTSLFTVANLIFLLFNVESTRQTIEEETGVSMSTTAIRVSAMLNIVVGIAMAYLYWRSARCNMQCNLKGW